MRVRLLRSGGSRTRGSWPWLHWCLFDRECRSYGCPADIYVHPLKLIIRFGGDHRPAKVSPWPLDGVPIRRREEP